MRRAGRALQLGQQAGHNATATLPLFRFGIFMKKEGGEAEQLGRDSWRILLSRHVAAENVGWRRVWGWTGWREREWNDVVGRVKRGNG